MALAKFTSTTDGHNQLSSLVSLVREQGIVVIITHHGSPKYALLPLEALETEEPEQIVGVRDLTKSFHQYLKKLEDWQELYITSHKKPVAQLLLIEPDDVDDMIVAASRHFQDDVDKYSTPEAANKLMSGSALLNELKALRSQARPKD